MGGRMEKMGEWLEEWEDNCKGVEGVARGDGRITGERAGEI
jgi:hypothetical protein